MPTREEFARLALALPEVTAGSHFAQPDFRVCGKIFCSLDRTGERAALKLRKDVQEPLLQARPDTFVAASGAWGASGWTHVELSRVAFAELRELVEDAWRLIAPKRLSAQRAPASEADVVLSAPATPARRRTGEARSGPAARASEALPNAKAPPKIKALRKAKRPRGPRPTRSGG